MKLQYSLLMASLCATFVSCQSTRTQTTGPIVFKNVSIVSMVSEQILRNQSVLVEDGIITRIAPSVHAPSNAKVIEGSGKFLMPALADMHVHIQNEQDLIVLAATGVSLVRNMHADSPKALKWRSESKRPAAFMPEIFAAGPLLDGPYKSHKGAVTETPDLEWNHVIQTQKAQGYDFIKVYDALSPKAFRAIMRAASAEGLSVVGHVPYQVGLHEVLKSKIRSLEHLSGFAEASELRESPYRRNYSRAWKDTQDYWSDAWHGGTGVRMAHADLSKFPSLAKLTKNSDVWICPTLIQRDTFVKNARGTIFADQSRWKYFPPAMTEGWKAMAKSSPYSLPPLRDLEKSWRNRRELVSELHRAKVPLLLGTDLGNVGVLAGFSVYEELQNFRDAGLSPYEAILTATRNASEFLGRNGGSVEVGKIADLILLSQNPLEDLKALDHREGLVLRGVWYAQSELQKKLDDLAAAYASGSLRPKTYYDH